MSFLFVSGWLSRIGSLLHTFFNIICCPSDTNSCFQVAFSLIGTLSPLRLRTLLVGDRSKAQTRPVHSVQCQLDRVAGWKNERLTKTHENEVR